jgi:hypothetical protein
MWVFLLIVGDCINVVSFMWVLVLIVQDCIKVVTASCECFHWLLRIVLRWWISCEFLYWLFRIVLRWWQFHVSVFIDCSRLYYGGDSFMWVFLLIVQDCIKVVRVSCECLYWLFRIVLRWWEFHVSVCIDCSGLY